MILFCVMLFIMASLPKELILKIFDTTTLKGDWDTRLKMLLTFPYLWGYSKSITHMKLLLAKWHSSCFQFKEKVEKPLPSTLDTHWLNNMILSARKSEDVNDKSSNNEIVFYAGYTYWSKCKYCGKMCLGPCNLL
jgi:hypothetical protein